MYCSCGCNKPLSAGEERINAWGELETMREECRLIGQGITEVDEEFMRELRYDIFLLDELEKNGYTITNEELITNGR